MKKQLIEAIRNNNAESAFDLLEAMKKEWPGDPVFAVVSNAADDEDDENNDLFHIDVLLKQMKSIFIGMLLVLLESI